MTDIIRFTVPLPPTALRLWYTDRAYAIRDDECANLQCLLRVGSRKQRSWRQPKEALLCTTDSVNAAVAGSSRMGAGNDSSLGITPRRFATGQRSTRSRSSASARGVRAEWLSPLLESSVLRVRQQRSATRQDSVVHATSRSTSAIVKVRAKRACEGRCITPTGAELFIEGIATFANQTARERPSIGLYGWPRRVRSRRGCISTTRITTSWITGLRTWR